MATPTPTPTITVLTSLFEADGSTLATTFTETLVDFTSTAASIVDGATRTSSGTFQQRALGLCANEGNSLGLWIAW